MYLSMQLWRFWLKLLAKTEQRECGTIPIPHLLIKIYVGVISSEELRLEPACLSLALRKSVRQCFYREFYG